MKNTLEGINNRITDVEERISVLEDKTVEITAEEQNKEKRMKRTEDNLRDLWDNSKHTNIRIIGVPEEKEKNKGSEKISEEIIVENFPNMGKVIVTQVQEAQRVPYRINPRKNTLEGINNRIIEAEKRISELEDKMVEITAEEQNKEKRKKN